MYRKTAAFLFILFSNTLSAQDIVQFKISKPYCIFNFFETAAGAPGNSITLKQFTEANIPKEDTAFYQSVKVFANLRLSYNYKREEFPTNRHAYRSTYDLLCIAAVKSTTLADFKEKTIGILTNSEHQKLFTLLALAEKYYDRIIWTAYEAKLKEQLNALEKYKKQCNEIFLLFKNFYNSSWTNDIPFTVAIYPIPGKRGVSTATPHANSLCVGVLTDETDHAVRIGVTMHEMCHVLYDEQLSSFQHQLDAAFMQSKSPFNKLAYGFFDEALATALGNAWTYQYINNKTDTSEWYNNTYINGFAHAIYPLARQYIANKKTIDNDFVAQAIRLFGEKFPKSPYDYSILLNNMYLYTDAGTNEERQELKAVIGKYFRMSSFNLSSPILHEYSVESLKNGKETSMIIIDRDHEITLNRLKEIFPAMKNYLTGKNDKNFVLSFFDNAKRPVIIIHTINADMLNKAIALMQKQKYIDESKPYIVIE
jgi:hypothetical protein